MEATEPASDSPKSDTQFFRIQSQVLIQESDTGHYFRAPGVWSVDEAHALKFRTYSAARECVTRLDLPNVRAVIQEEFRECQIVTHNNKPLRVWPAEGGSNAQ